MIKINNNKIKKIFLGNVKVKKVYVGNTKVWTAGNTVTYHIVSSYTNTKEVDYGDNCLDTKYTSQLGHESAKPPYTFLGWKLNDASASASNLITTKPMEDSPLTFYAVYYKKIRLTYNANGGSGTTSQGEQTQYYNNGNYSGIQLANNNFSKVGYTFVNWAAGSVNGTRYNPASWTSAIRDNTTMYAIWQPQSGGYTKWWGKNNDGMLNVWGNSDADIGSTSGFTIDCTGFKSITWSAELQQGTTARTAYIELRMDGKKIASAIHADQKHPGQGDVGGEVNLSNTNGNHTFSFYWEGDNASAHLKVKTTFNPK